MRHSDVDSLLSGATVWVDGLAVVQSAPLLRIAAERGVTLDREDEPPAVMVERDGLPRAMQIERVTFCGWLRMRWATAWCREQSHAIAGSPVPWDTSEIFPWVVEIHLRTPELEGSKDGSTALTVPCRVDPRIPSPEADAAICLAVARAMLHEGQESLMLDDSRALDPHVFGERGLVEVAERMEAWLPSRT